MDEYGNFLVSTQTAIPFYGIDTKIFALSRVIFRNSPRFMLKSDYQFPKGGAAE